MVYATGAALPGAAVGNVAVLDHAYRKITLHLIPFIFICLFNYLDRVNVGFVAVLRLAPGGSMDAEDVGDFPGIAQMLVGSMKSTPSAMTAVAAQERIGGGGRSSAFDWGAHAERERGSARLDREVAADPGREPGTVKFARPCAGRR